MKLEQMNAIFLHDIITLCDHTFGGDIEVLEPFKDEKPCYVA